MKLKHAVIIIALIIIADQALKIWIKTNYDYGRVMYVANQKWFQLHFIENKGMAWGWEFGGEWGKMILTLFRLAAVIFGTWYLGRIVKQKYSKGFIICASLIYAGALGNLIDSMFYGLIFSKSDEHLIAHWVSVGQGYAGFLHGHVVDMLYFPIIRGHYPDWFPFGWGGDRFEFFSPIFNIADASISIGVITLFIFQKRFFKKQSDEQVPAPETNAPISDKVQVL